MIKDSESPCKYLLDKAQVALVPGSLRGWKMHPCLLHCIHIKFAGSLFSEWWVAVLLLAIQSYVENLWNHVLILREFSVDSNWRAGAKTSLNGFFYSKQGCFYTMTRRGPHSTWFAWPLLGHMSFCLCFIFVFFKKNNLSNPSFQIVFQSLDFQIILTFQIFILSFLFRLQKYQF